MTVQAYGTRGSSPVSRPEASRYGGNTTCYRVVSQCIPAGAGLVVDGGSGLVPASRDLMREGRPDLHVLMTHYHHDHTQGFPLSPHTHARGARVHVVGPREHDVGPREMLECLMKAPYFPVDFSRVASRFECREVESIGCEVLLVHPVEGFHLVRVDEFETLRSGGSMSAVPFTRASLDECLVVWMYKALHPEYTVSYRFEEWPTGKVLVILTDHENTDSVPDELRAHVDRADLLIQDAQFTRAEYETGKAGFGHGTGDYAARVFLETDARLLGHTHHDPLHDDADVDAVVAEAREWLAAHGAEELAIVAGPRSVRILVHAVANASYGHFFARGRKRFEPAHFQKTFEAMSDSFVYWTQALLDRELLADGARLVAFSNPMVDSVVVGWGLVVAVKAALEQYVRHLGHEIGPWGTG